ncbi:MAG: hypothetical protein WDW38_007458 [Sanguina aurantia]
MVFTTHPSYNQTKSRAASIPALCGSAPSQLVCGADSQCGDSYSCAASSCSCTSANPSTNNAFFDINYGTGSAAGSMYSGALGLPGATNYQSMPVVFGCDLKTSGLYDSQNSGVFGLNYQPASMYSQMAARGLITRQLSFCLGSGQAGNEAEAGFLILGDSTVKGLAAHKQYAIKRLKTTARTGPYSNAFFDGLWVELLSVQFPGGGGADFVAGNRLTPVALFDTGTSLTYLPPTALAAVVKALSAYAAKSSLIVSQAVGQFQAFPNAISFTATRVLTRQQLDSIWPPLLFTFPSFNGTGRTTVPISFSSSILYLANSNSGQPVYLNTMQDSGDDGQAILGNTWTEHILLQSDQVAQTITLTPLTSCGDVTF